MNAAPAIVLAATTLEQVGEWFPKFHSGRLPTRAEINELQRLVQQLPQVELPVKHYFGEGTYVREIYIPKGVVLVGEEHKSDEVFVMLKGDVMVWTEKYIKRFTGASTNQAERGTKRVGYVYEDVVWSSIHPNPTNERDEKKLRASFVVPDMETVLF